MNKFEKLSNLYNDGISKIFSDVNEWKKFMSFSFKFYRFSFDKQLLIYSQKLTATALLSFDEWADSGRRIKAGSKGIHVFTDETNKKTECFFDISQTRETEQSKRIVFWQMNKENIQDLSSYFSKYFMCYGGNDFNETVKNVTDQIIDLGVVYNIEDLYDIFSKYDISQEKQKEYIKLIKESSQYSVMNRCNIDTDIDLSKFSDIFPITNNEIRIQIAKTINTCTNMQLSILYMRDLGILNDELEEEVNYGSRYNEMVHNRPELSEQTRTRGGRSVDRYTLQAGGGRNVLSRPRTDRPKSGKSVRREIRSDLQGVSEEQVSSNFQFKNNRRNSGSRLLGNERSSVGRSGENDGTGSSKIRSDRGIESTRPVEMGAGVQLSSSHGRGNSHSGHDIWQSLSNLIEKADSDKLAAFLDPKFLIPIIRNDNNVLGEDDKEDIIQRLANNDVDTTYIKSLFPFKYCEFYINEEMVGCKGDANGLLVWKGSYFTRTHQSYFKWETVQQLINNLIETNRYYVENTVEDIKALADDLTDKVNTKIEDTENKVDNHINNNAEQLSLFDFLKSNTRDSSDINLSSKNVIEATYEEIIPKNEKNNTNKINYKIVDDNLGVMSDSKKFKANMAAVKALKAIEQDNRLATFEEQEILSKYVGWGGLSSCFDKNHVAYNELVNTLNEEEFDAARKSTRTAFYTPPLVIKAMFDILENLGYENGTILEPSCGVGNFFGMLPEKMQDSKLYGIELDSISGRIAKQLYQKANITIDGYQNVDIADNSIDVVIGNVPFDNFKLDDKRYDKNNFLIHDYFFAKSLDKVKAGGIVLFITSKGTMDKVKTDVREYLAQRADLIGAIRLPNDTFSANAGTKVTSDIIVLQKREEILQDVSNVEWVQTSENDNGIAMNNYFISNPNMILGNMVMTSTQYGMDSTCIPNSDSSLVELLDAAIASIQGEIKLSNNVVTDSPIIAIPENIDSEIRNYSYNIIDGKLCFKDNTTIEECTVSQANEARIIDMIKIRDNLRYLIKLQLEDYPEDNITQQRTVLNELYNVFTEKHGLLNSKNNKRVFKNDNSYPLLASLEKIDGDGNLIGKSDIFTKRTIKPRVEKSHVNSAMEALHASLNKYNSINAEYMEKIYDKQFTDIESELVGVIYRVPHISDDNHIDYIYQTEDEYLSGNIREKLKIAKNAAIIDSYYQYNVDQLTAAMPKELDSTEINVQLGSTWLPTSDIKDFISDLFNVINFEVNYYPISGEWEITNKYAFMSSVKSSTLYGTERISAIDIIERALNLRDVRIYDTVYVDGKEKRVLNGKETALANGKLDIIKDKFANWIWNDYDRRQRLTKYYNEKFNSTVPRQYNGEHLELEGINCNISLRKHQKNAVAHALYGGNTLFAHVVGAGKTYTMIATAMEKKRLGLCNKSIVVVPNHIIPDFASEWYNLYPNANLLVTTEDDFKPDKRKEFCSRIATSDIDAVIIGHSQFQKIPLSKESQEKYLQKQIDNVLEAIEQIQADKGKHFTVKQYVKIQQNLEKKLEKLNSDETKDDVITFEELGCDQLFVDEADEFKNLYAYTKMQNIAGLNQTEAQKSSDMLMKCQYINELTDYKGVVFATGTPISNSMVELYTMQKYLQPQRLEDMNLNIFDAWASMFGEAVTENELSPEGKGFRLKTRFANFHNIPELMFVFKEIADIQTEDMLNLPVPKANYRVISVQPNDVQKDMINSMSERADKIRNGGVDPKDDNMLKIITEGKKLALDQRLLNPLLPDNENSKVNACVNEVKRIWDETTDIKGTQLIFCDLSTPKSDEFNVYDDIKQKLINNGIPENEIAYIHDANTSQAKKALFSKVRCGDVRILMGSTQKMGAGTNVQDLIVASHDLDCPWRPRDLEQRRGRSIRQGNKNNEVDVIRYVTEGTFDAYLYQTIEKKQKFINQIMTSKNPARTIEDIDEATLNYAEIKMIATGNPIFKEKMDLDLEVSKLTLQKQAFLKEKYSLENKVLSEYPNGIRLCQDTIAKYENDISIRQLVADGEFAGMKIDGQVYLKRAEAGAALVKKCKVGATSKFNAIDAGEYRGFKMKIYFDVFSKEFQLNLIGNLNHTVALGNDGVGNITRIDNCLKNLEKSLDNHKNKLENINKNLEIAKSEMKNEFPHDELLETKKHRLNEVNKIINELDSRVDNQEKTNTPQKEKNSEIEL